jgi:hypothetical protein
MARHNTIPLTQEEIIARLEKPKSMRYIRLNSKKRSTNGKLAALRA